ncbi:conserved Plasmodium protein, unknown function [Plasmodium gallinaceum]|uniref:Uncharacterized protein n=1 Tax=Plasmodium gallinaceum TaxID=5849 RepID=A0A1J1GW27_PLAGA|nr:conserved Plasmodium protein, unknown function [Plasmodium gallinaceum]CRG95220.1 conserved Plasmodium protein, unknown function [Plasmodium gallinaceum]
MKEQCLLVPGEFGIIVQIFIGCVSLSVLLTKYILENPRRSFITFLKDLISILCGSVILHSVNIFISILIFRCNILLYLCNIDMDECSIYFIQIIIDATFGLYLEYKIFPIYKFIKIRREYLYNNSNGSIYKPIDALSHYSSFLNLTEKNNKKGFDDKYNINSKNNLNIFKLIFFNFKKYLGKKKYNFFSKNKTKNLEDHNGTANIFEEKIFKQDIIFNGDHIFYNFTTNEKIDNKKQTNEKSLRIYNDDDDDDKNELTLLNDKTKNKEFSIQLNENILFDYDDIIIYENKNLDIYKEIDENYSNLSIFHGTILWISVVLTAKCVTLLSFFLLSPIFNIFVLYTLSLINDMKFKLLIVMVILPFFLNFIIYFFTDSIIKTKNTYININYDKI